VKLMMNSGFHEKLFHDQFSNCKILKKVYVPFNYLLEITVGRDMKYILRCFINMSTNSNNISLWDLRFSQRWL
jgi:hypothetical protein